ncbi:hypothetical protein DV737_g4840, partial [Chaetothyriales sp. CBS 132003]
MRLLNTFSLEVVETNEQIPNYAILSHTRGWTLQELIAPSSVLFYNRHWTPIGSKASLRKKISEKTRVPYSVLLGYDDSRVSIADKMKWAAARKTTRPEDSAYCLMGLFDVNMPIIYGEGKKAFYRLQQEIIRSSNDHTIFAWTSADDSVHIRDLFANDPSDFLQFSRLYGSIQQRPANSRKDLPYYMTNIGLRCQLPFRKAVNVRTCSWVLLDCQIEASRRGRHPLQVLMGLDNTNDDHYVRNGRFLPIDYDEDLNITLPLSDLVIKQSTGPRSFYDANTVQNPYISYPDEETHAPGRFRFLAKYPPYDSPNPTGPDGRLNSVDQPKVIGVAYCHTDGSNRYYFTVVVGFGRGSPWCDIRPFRVPPGPKPKSYFDFYTSEIVAALSEYDKDTLETALLQTDKLSDRATKQLGCSNIHAEVLRGPRGLKVHSKDSEVYILHLSQKPIP